MINNMPNSSISNYSRFYSFKGTEAKIIEQLLDKHKFILYVIDNEADAETIASSINFFKPNAQIIIMPSWDVLPYDRVSPSLSVELKRVNALNSLLSPFREQVVLIASANSLIQKLPPKEIIKSALINIKLNQTIVRDDFLRSLNELGYIRSTTANNSGEYAVRGGVIDIVVNDNNQGYRLSFFGDEVDSIKLFDTDTQMSSDQVSSCIISPVSEAILNDKTALTFKENYRKLFGLANDPLIESISEKSKYSGMEHWLPLFYDGLNTLFDYIPKDSAIVHHDSFQHDVEEQFNLISDSYNLRTRITSDTYRPLHYGQLYLDVNEAFSRTSEYTTIALSPHRNEKNIELVTPTRDLHIESKQENKSAFELLKEYMKSLKAENVKQKLKPFKFFIACFTNGSRERLKNMLQDVNFHIVLVSSWEQAKEVSGNTIGLIILPIEQGFIQENYVILSEQNILGSRLSRSSKRKKSSNKFLQEINSLAEGDYVVHIEHGIGRFEKIEALTVEGIIHDFIKITYKDDDKLYVPVENLELITRYGGEDTVVELDKLGSAAWQARKAKLKNRLKIAAEELLKVAAKREVAEGIILEPINDIYEKFCQKFPYVETEDQLNAIQDVAEDLASGKCMDRLVCGDVGFGKTEVALRAACIAVASSNPVQVAVVVPTTLLARQHYQSFMNRFDGFPIKVAQLSRFVSTKEAQQTKKDMAEGKVDIVIGTHSLLAKDIKFKNLGLIIIDEEQHFGVAQKEKLKNLRASTHILTLSATPIPRTLQMSLTGIKDLSLITTPPVDRLPIKTSVMPYDAFIIREAILREHNRGGRTFYVTPRVAYLTDLEQKLKEVVPEIKVAIAHGQMPASKLDTIMNQFYDGKFEVLLSTTIVESGLDIPFANTMIVDRADMFGLAQLYQIRGRIGRSNARAYAYLITTPGSKLNPIAKRRLEVIQSLETLGSGFMIASHDMDIRGYGNLVGEEQSGHIREVGLELYQDMLAEAIENLKQQNEVYESSDWSPTINIGVSVQIPEDYINSDSLRLSIYRKIAEITEIDELEGFAAELIDRFGPLPNEAEQLFATVKIKQLAKNRFIEKIEAGEKALVITFKNNKPKDAEAILSFINKHSSQAKLRADGKLLIMREWKTENSRVKGIENILLQLNV